MGNPIFKDVPPMAASFKDAVQTGIAQRLGGVASVHDNTIIADMSHKSASAYSIVGNEQSMAALKSAGVKHIALEALDTSDQPILDAHARGGISDRAMDHYLRDMVVLNYESDYGAPPKMHNNAIADLVGNAKKQGISVHGVNGFEGIGDPEKLKPVLEDLGQMKLNLLQDIDKHPEFYAMNHKGQGNFVRNNLQERGYEPDETEAILAGLGLGAKSLGGIAGTLSKKDWIERFEGDKDVAERTILQTQGEKTVVIYGAGHVLRPGYDLDGLLRNSATIEVFDDKKQYERDILPGQEEAMNELGMSLQDRGNFSFDLKDGTWNDDQGNQVRLDVQADNQNLLPAEQQQKIIRELKF